MDGVNKLIQTRALAVSQRTRRRISATGVDAHLLWCVHLCKQWKQRAAGGQAASGLGMTRRRDTESRLLGRSRNPSSAKLALWGSGEEVCDGSECRGSRVSVYYQKAEQNVVRLDG